MTMTGDRRRFDLLRGRLGGWLWEDSRELRQRGEHNVVPPGDWIGNRYYVGGVEIWPAIKDLFVELVDGRYNVIVLRGAAGWAKTFLGRLLLLRSIYEIGCKEHPHADIGSLSKAIPLRIALIHMNRDRAREELLDPLVYLVQSSGWYRDNFPPQTRIYSGTGEESTFLSFHRSGRPVLRVRPVVTRAEAVVGLDLVAAHLSECNKYDVVENSRRVRGEESYDAAMQIYTELRTRLLTRYHKPLAPCIRVVMDSSERYEDDFLSRVAPTLARDQEGGGLRSIVVSKSTWETQPGANRGPFFLFCKPRKGARSEVVETDERKAQLIESGRDVVEIPIGGAQEFLTAAKRDPDWFARDVGGWPTDAICRWLRDPDALAVCRETRLRWLEDRGLPTAQAVPERFTQGHSKIDWDLCCTRPSGGVGWRPRVCPDRERFIHVDLADTGDDYLGLSMGCVVDIREDGPVLWCDFATRICKDVDEYRLDDVRRLIEDIRDHGYWIKLVTFDRYQSTQIIQALSDRGFSVGRVSVHQPPDAYDHLQAAVMTGRLLIDAGPILSTEMTQLEALLVGSQRKVHHRKGGHDDVADAVAGWVWQSTLAAKRSLAEPLDARLPGSISVEEVEAYSSRRIM